jgi:transposase
MATNVKNNKINFKGKTVNVGIDLHKAFWRITAVVETEVIMAFTLVNPKYSAFKKILSQFEGNYVRIAYEAGPGGFDLYDRLTSDGIECIVTPPSLIPIASGNKVKTDKRDSLKIAKLLESNMLKRVWVLTAEQRAHRQLVRTRRQIVVHRSDVMHQIKSLLLFHSIEIPFSSEQHWSRSFILWLHEIDLGDKYLNLSLKALVGLLDYLNAEKKKLTCEVVQLAKDIKYASRVKLLKSIPGIGALSAMEILVELQDIRRFQSSSELASYLGLTPSQHSSGEQIRMGHITHTGNSRVRTTLIESSWILIRKDPQMRLKYENIKYRGGSKRAIVAIARSLSTRIRTILFNQVPYEIGFQKAAFNDLLRLSKSVLK